MAVTPSGWDSIVDVDIVLGVNIKGCRLVLNIRRKLLIGWKKISVLHQHHLGLEGRVIVALGDDAGLDAVLLQLVTTRQRPGQETEQKYI